MGALSNFRNQIYIRRMIVLVLRLNKVNPFYLLIGILATVAISLGFSNIASAHGYVESPESRSLLCKEGANQNCGGIEYEPQSVEGPGNYPAEGVEDGKIAGGGGWGPLNDQSEDRWAKVPLSSGANQFTWKLTAAHSTAKWDYYITKEGWNPNDPLKRDDFEKFCTIDDGGARPDFSVTHDCVVPERDGYHVILAYWEVADTANAFYQVIDVNFDGDYVEPDPDPEPEPDPDPEPEPDPDPEVPGDAAAYDSSKVYLGGDQVTHDGNTYEALWWTQGQEPGTNSVWVLVSEGDGGDDGNGNGGDDGDTPAADAYDAAAVYLGGDLVTYDGNTYKAAWWTLGEEPGSSAVWVVQ